MALPIERLEQEILRLPWRILLPEPVIRVDGEPVASRPSFSVAIPLLGAWSGWLTVSCDARVVHEIATRLRQEELVRPADLDEAAQWLVTALGQSLRPVLDPSSTLGVPVVLDPLSPWSPASCRLAARLQLRSGDRSLEVILHERVPFAVRSTGTFPSDVDASDAAAAAVEAPPAVPLPARVPAKP